MAGLISRVRPVGLPCRPLKLRFEDDAHTSRPSSRSGFNGQTHRASGTAPVEPQLARRPGRDPLPRRLAEWPSSLEPRALSRAWPRVVRQRLAPPRAGQIRREFVHEPTNATSTFVPRIGAPASNPMNSRASAIDARSPPGLMPSGLGMRSPIPTDCPGLIPQVTRGSIASPSSTTTSS